MSSADLLIKGGTIVDGSGGEPYCGDVAILGDRILYVGSAFEGTAASVIDAAGLTVTPGFVDIHTHYDGQAIWSDTLSPSSSHGVTTVVMGNCGVGFAPCRPEDRERLIKVMEGVEDIPDVVMAKGLDWDWETFPDYLNALDARPHDIDVAAFLPHSPLRVYAMGERGAAREPATAQELAEMQRITREALAAGALGFATSRLTFHRTPGGDNIPSYDADEVELLAIADAMREADAGVVQMVLNVPMRSWAEETGVVVRVTERSGRPSTYTLGLSNTGERTWDASLALCAEAKARGLSVAPQILPRPVGMVAGFELSTHPFCLCPTYQAIANLPLTQQLPYLTDPAFRAKLIAEPPLEGLPLAMMTRMWDFIFPFGDPPLYEPDPATSLGAQARARGMQPEEIAYDLLMADGGTGKLYIALGNYFEGNLDAVGDLMAHPDVVLGLGDGGAHYAAICDASYSTFVLTHWLRDREGTRLTVAAAVRALAARPAEVVGLLDRGRLAKGYKADLNIIDLDRLRLHAPVVRHDLPAGGRRLDQGATGYVATLCNGKIIRRDDKDTGLRPGRLVRGAQAAPPAL